MAKKISLILSFLFLISAPFVTRAASLSFSPAGGSVTVGDRVTVKVVVTTPASVNAVSGDIIVPPSLFTIDAVSKSGSFLNFWVTEPSLSRQTGTVHFEGVVLSGFQGTGTVLTLTLRPVAKGSGAITLKNMQVLANDGEGTSLQNTINPASFTVKERDAVPPPPKAEEAPLIPPATTSPDDALAAALDTALMVPAITSPTHPDPTRWYSTNDVRLQWSFSREVIGIQTLLNNQPESVPQGKPEALTGERFISGLKDGISYFHLRFVGKKGVSSSTTYVLRIDNQPPANVSAEVVRGKDDTLTVSLAAEDEVSGIDYFNVYVDAQEPEKVVARDGKASYILPRYLSLGNHTLTVIAYDRAYNKTERVIPITIDRIPQPVLTVTSRFPIVGTTMSIAGQYALPGELVYVYVKKPNHALETYLVKADSEGRFTVRAELPLGGIYELWNERANKEISAATSEITPVTVRVRGKTLYHVKRVMALAQPFVLVLLTVAFVIVMRPQAQTKKPLKNKAISAGSRKKPTKGAPYSNTDPALTQ